MSSTHSPQQSKHDLKMPDSFESPSNLAGTENIWKNEDGWRLKVKLFWTVIYLVCVEYTSK